MIEQTKRNSFFVKTTAGMILLIGVIMVIPSRVSPTHALVRDKLLVEIYNKAVSRCTDEIPGRIEASELKIATALSRGDITEKQAALMKSRNTSSTVMDDCLLDELNKYNEPLR